MILKTLKYDKISERIIEIRTRITYEWGAKNQGKEIQII